MAPPPKACDRPRQLLRVLALSCFIKVAFCLYVAFVSWFSSMEPPVMQSRVTHLTLDGNTPGRSSHEKGERICTVTERPSLKVRAALPYSNLMSLLHDRRPDGSINEDFYGGNQFTIWKHMLPFISWDGERMLKIAIDELVYGSEELAAFFPLLPWLANIGGKALKFIHLKTAMGHILDPASVEAPKVIYMGIAGLIITNVAGILAAVALYMLIWEVLYRRKLLAESGGGLVPVFTTFPDTPMPLTVDYIENIAFFGVLFFCLGPATVHCTSIYTENLFCLFTFTGLLLLYAAEDNRKLVMYGKGGIGIAFLKSYIFEVAAVALFFLASASRSNGLLLLIPLFFYTVRTCGLIRKLNMLDAYDHGCLGIQGVTESGNISCLACLRFIGHWLRALLYAITIMVPMAVFQLYLYCLYCFRLSMEHMQGISRFTDFVRLLVTPKALAVLRNILTAEKRGARPYCATMPPSVYSFIQKEYWDVGFLWILRPPSRLHVFLYCWHAYLVTYFALLWYGTFLKTLYSNIAESTGKSKHGIGLWSFKAIVTVISHTEFGIHLHMFVTVFTFLFFAHTHVYMRQALPLVPYALNFAVIAEQLGRIKGFRWRKLWTLSGRHQMVMLLIFFNVGLCFIGGALFANFIGFT